MAIHPHPPDTGNTCLDPAIRSGAGLMPTLPFVIIAAISVSRLMIGPGCG